MSLSVAASMVNPRACGGTCAFTLPECRKAEFEETRSKRQGASIKSRAPLKNSINAAPEVRCSSPRDNMLPLEGEAPSQTASADCVSNATPAPASSRCDTNHNPEPKSTIAAAAASQGQRARRTGADFGSACESATASVDAHSARPRSMSACKYHCLRASASLISNFSSSECSASDSVPFINAANLSWMLTQHLLLRDVWSHRPQASGG